MKSPIGAAVEPARGIQVLPLHQKWVEKKAHFGQVFGYEQPLYLTKPPNLFTI